MSSSLPNPTIFAPLPATICSIAESVARPGNEPIRKTTAQRYVLHPYAHVICGVNTYIVVNLHYMW